MLGRICGVIERSGSDTGDKRVVYYSDFIDHAAARGLYSRFMDVFPPEAHA